MLFENGHLCILEKAFCSKLLSRETLSERKHFCESIFMANFVPNGGRARPKMRRTHRPARPSGLLGAVPAQPAFETAPLPRSSRANFASILLRVSWISSVIFEWISPYSGYYTWGVRPHPLSTRFLPAFYPLSTRFLANTHISVIPTYLHVFSRNST